MGKSTISMAIFNSYVELPEGKFHITILFQFPVHGCHSNSQNQIDQEIHL
jgi:DNA-directed RNA polymerase specialized sigma54-like protein